MTGKPGEYNGRHFTTWVDTVKELKRQGDTVEAVSLLGHLVEATEAESRDDHRGVAPWYYEQLAILYRKAGNNVAEVAILERYESQQPAPGAGPAKLAARLTQARALVARS